MTTATKKLLFDVREAAESILQHTGGKGLAEYSSNRLLRRGVEREFEIIGEALKRLSRLDAATSARISELRRIVDFRNRVIHGYDTVDDMVVLGVAQEHLPLLLQEISDLLGTGESAA